MSWARVESRGGAAAQATCCIPAGRLAKIAGLDEMVGVTQEV